MRDLKLNGLDLAIENGDLVIIEGAEEVAQNVGIRLRWVLAEWDFDYSLGVPWKDGMFDVSYPEILKRANILDTIRKTPGVQAVLNLQFFIDSEQRGCLVAYRARTVYGEYVEGEVSL